MDNDQGTPKLERKKSRRFSRRFSYSIRRTFKRKRKRNAPHSPAKQGQGKVIMNTYKPIIETFIPHQSGHL